MKLISVNINEEEKICPVCKNGIVGNCVCAQNIKALTVAGKKLVKDFGVEDAKSLLNEYLTSPLAGKPTLFIKGVYGIK